MKHLLYLFIITISLSACKGDIKKNDKAISKGESISVDHATGFTIVNYPGFKLLTVKSPWPDADTDFVYALIKKGTTLPKNIQFNQKINIPVETVVLTSTTFIPAIEALGETTSLIGFPNLDYISSKDTRQRIDAGKVTELGANEAINTEVLLELQPDAVIGFSVDGQNTTFNTIKNYGIPVILNGDWLESSPLGKAEWLKFFGALYDKSDLAEELFDAIVKRYNTTKSLAESAIRKPTVLSGSMYKDVWYLPYGNSWQAQFIKDANAQYIYSTTQGKGSIALAFEDVLDNAQNADVWIAPGSFSSYDDMKNATPHYEQFKAFKQKNIYGFAGVKGETGGVLFYELGPNRPDLILNDLVKAFHPELLPNYKPTFIKPLE